jgi:hypothetical protein
VDENPVDVAVELLQGMAEKLMSIDARLETLVRLVEGDDGEEEADA